MLINKNFLARLPIGWQHNSQPIRSHVRKLILPNIGFNMDLLSNPGHIKITADLQNITVTSWWARWRLKSTASRLFTQPFIQAQINDNIKVPRHWPLCVEFTGDRENVSIWWSHHGNTYPAIVPESRDEIPHHQYEARRKYWNQSRWVGSSGSRRNGVPKLEPLKWGHHRPVNVINRCKNLARKWIRISIMDSSKH